MGAPVEISLACHETIIAVQAMTAAAMLMQTQTETQ